MPTAGDQVPDDITGLARRIAALEREVRELRAAKRASKTAVTSGQFAVITPDGRQIFGVGQWDANGHYGALIRRDDGSLALTVSGQESARSDMIRIYPRDNDDDPIISDDAWSGRYLGRPSLPIPWQPTSIAAAYTSATMGTAWIARQRVQNPVFNVLCQTFCPASTNAALELTALIGSATVVWDSWTAAGGGSGAWTNHEITVPMHGTNYFQLVQWELRHRRSSGTGTIQTNVMGGYQRNTVGPEEIPI
ncbi:MAG: hypothetical protein LC792_01720 [Actinobacteria bacterium]|nr:hypothetical protein [Actinomycetota bacterium]